MRTTLLLIALPIAAAVACGDNSTPQAGAGAGAGGAGTSAGAANGGASSAGAPSGVSGAPSVGAGSDAGGAVAAGSPSTAGQPSTSGGNGGQPGTAGAGTSAGAAGAGSSTACTRELLKATVDAYFKALATHDPGTLPLAVSVKLTENGKASTPGDAGLWKTAGTLKYVHSALDTDQCMSASEAVVPDGATDIPVALRLKLENQKITEIEMIAVRAGDYSLTSNTAALAASNTTIKWEDPVAADQRNTRTDLTSWMQKYYKQFPNGVCDTTATCKRIENGAGSFVCSEGAGCSASTTSTVLKSRLVLADVDSGLGVGFTMFTGGYTDMHMFKMYGDQVYAVSAILAKADSSGWD